MLAETFLHETFDHVRNHHLYLPHSIYLVKLLSVPEYLSQNIMVNHFSHENHFLRLS